MVYRGKPSAGCENCRKAKKRCGLEQPACFRCVKLKKICSGYRDTTQLQIQDESESVKIKANRQKNRTPLPTSDCFAPPGPVRIENGITRSESPRATAPSPHSDPSTTSDETIDLPLQQYDQTMDFNSFTFENLESVDLALNPGFGMPFALKPRIDDIATTYFFSQFTALNGHWTYLREQAVRPHLDPLVEIAIRACGMAALDNVQGLPVGRPYTRSLYAQALGLLNAALRDPKQCKTDDALIACSMLAYFENLSCDRRESIQSWKAHITGATQLLKLRGKGQFKTRTGRMLFRETRSSILIHCIWDDLEPPAFLLEWENELERQTPDRLSIKPADDLILITFDFATLRSQMQTRKITDEAASEMATQIEMKMVQWSINTMSHSGDAWMYYDLEVPDSPHVWNGVVHAYKCHPAPSVWNTYRNMRILLTRTQELLMQRFELPPEQKEAQTAYFRSVRRQMTDDICAGIPSQLGHATPAYNSPCIVISAYASIWPLFFACTCALERIGPNARDESLAGNVTYGISAAASQAYWLIGRMDFISQSIGLRWADGVAATLRGDFRIHSDLVCPGDPQIPPWIQKIEKSGRGPRILMEQDTPLSDALAHPREEYGPIWLGKASGSSTRLLTREEIHDAKIHGWPMDKPIGA